MSISCILFDAVGTLLEPHPPVAEAYWLAGRRFGSRLTKEEIAERFRAAWAKDSRRSLATSEAAERERWRRIVRAIFHELPAEAGEELFSALWGHFAQPNHWRLFADVAPAWRDLSALGLPIGVASNFDARLRTIAAAHAPLATCQTWFISSELGWAKPESGFYAAVEAQLRLSPAEILLIGDDLENDVLAPRRRGWNTLHLRRGAQVGSAGEVDSLLQVTARLQQMDGGVS